MRMMIFVMLALILGVNFYVFFRLWYLIPAVPFVRPLLVVFAVLAVSSMFIVLLLGNQLPSGVVAFLYTLGTSWFFIVLYLVMAFGALDLLRLTHLLPVGRYLFASWIGFGAIAVVIIGIFTAGYLNYQNKKREEIRIELPPEKKMDRPLKILAVSDLHLGYTIGKKEFARWVELINAERPDLVLIAGDILDNQVRPVIEQNIASLFGEIKAKFGVYACLGNHEYISGLPQALDFIDKTGIHLLRDSAVLIDSSFYIAGRDDRTNPHRKSLDSLLEGVDRSKPILLLDHQPYHLEEAKANGVTFQFSGHTHHGQVWPISLITDGMYENAYGYLKKGDTHIYVSSGLGIWGGKFRIGTRSEYVVITIE